MPRKATKTKHATKTRKAHAAKAPRATKAMITALKFYAANDFCDGGAHARRALAGAGVAF